MSDFIELVNEAVYEHVETGERVTLKGLRSENIVVVQNPDGEYLNLHYHDVFNKEYKDTGIHDHEAACCTVHNTHTSPHMGCLLR